MANTKRSMDEQEKAIAQLLVKNPRATDKSISEELKLPLRTVGRKRRRLEDEGLLRYYAEIELGPKGIGQNLSRHLYTIRFRSGVRLGDVRGRISEGESMVRFNGLVYESYIAESDGHLALVTIIEGESEEEVVRNVHDNLIPSIIKNHGSDSIVDVSAMRLVECSRKIRNYLPGVNFANEKIKSNWPIKNIYVGK